MGSTLKSPALEPGVNRIEFPSSGTRVVGNVFCPENLEGDKEYPALVAAGPLASVKEQAPGIFAQALATRGYIALAFDYRRYGESEGEPRQYEDPASKTEDFQNAVSFLRTLENVDANRLGALGICASSSYISAALMSDTRIGAFGTVSAHFSLYEFFAANPLASDEQKSMMLVTSNESRQHYFETGEVETNDMVWPDMTGEEEGQFFQDIYDYYFARRAEEWPRFSNHLVPFSYEQLLRSHALDYAPHVTIPYLGIVGSEAVTRSYTERFAEAKERGLSQVEVIDGATHIQTYDRPEYVGQAVDALDTFYGRHL